MCLARVSRSVTVMFEPPTQQKGEQRRMRSPKWAFMNYYVALGFARSQHCGDIVARDPTEGNH
jgi:hypothetical protein